MVSLFHQIRAQYKIFEEANRWEWEKIWYYIELIGVWINVKREALTIKSKTD